MANCLQMYMTSSALDSIDNSNFMAAKRRIVTLNRASVRIKHQGDRLLKRLKLLLVSQAIIFIDHSFFAQWPVKACENMVEGVIN